MSLKILFATKNVTQSEMAEKLKVSQAAISKWETGKSVPRLDKMQAIAKVLNCDLSEIVECFSEGK